MRIYAKPEFKIARLKSGYSIIGLANEVGLTKQMIGQVERRMNGISPEKSKEVTDLLGVKFDDVFEIVERT